MKCTDVIARLEQMAPLSFAEAWDNVGLLLGRQDKEIHKIYIAVDATDEVVEEAITEGADMLLTHHPMIFKPLKRITDGQFIERRVLQLLQEDICYYAMHTNFDVMGMADAAADILDLQNRQVLYVTYEDEISKEGIGRYGSLPKVMNLRQCGEYVKETFGLQAVRVYGDLCMQPEIAAVFPGSGKSAVEPSLEAGVDVLITGDMDHHTAIDLSAQGIAVIDAGHYGIEKIFVPYMRDYLARETTGVQIKMAVEKSPYEVI